ncbi:MAG: hypothetical protein Q9182_002790 [Xanthomendoza sp. 2 TL-2023]
MLRQNSTTYVTSPIFSVGQSNGTSTKWTSASESSGQQSLVSSAIQQATPTPQEPVPSNDRPDIPLPGDGPVDRYNLPDGTNCTDVSGTQSNSAECWENLHLSEWLQQWFSIGKSPLSNARYEYVKTSIINIQQFFSAWWTALNDAIEHSSSHISGIIDLIDQPERDIHRGIFLNVFLTVLGVALGFIPVIGPTLGAGVGIANEVITGVTKVPAIAQKLWPSGTENTKSLQIDALTNDIQNTLQPSLKQNFNETLQIIQGLQQNDTSAFLVFADKGKFALSTKDSPTAKTFDESNQKVLIQAMNTFLVSEVLARNGWQVLILPGVDGEGINNGTQSCPQWAVYECNASKDIGCSGLDEYGQCNDYYWWFSKEQQSMYTLTHDGKTEEKAIGFIQKIFGDQWSTGRLLFEKYTSCRWLLYESANYIASAAKCELRNILFSLKQQVYNYTISLNGQAGFQYSASIPQAVNFEKQQGSDFFLPIAGSGFVELSKLAIVNAGQFHPISNPFSFNTVDFNLNPACVSNLNVSIANSWKSDNWIGNNPEDP